VAPCHMLGGNHAILCLQDWGRTALWMAAVRGGAEVVQLLTGAPGIDVNLADEVIVDFCPGAH
jgi:hypothetical protein